MSLVTLPRRLEKVKKDEVDAENPVGEAEEIENAVSNSKAIKKMVTAADTNGEHYKLGIKTNLLS